MTVLWVNVLAVGLNILLDYATDNDATLVTVTHDRDLFDRFERIVDFQQFFAVAGEREEV